MKVWGVSVSYFTGKLEAYLRYKGIDYEMEPPFRYRDRILPIVGAMQVPLLERDDGRWMSDTSPTILHLETEYPERPVLPEDPVVRFIALLMEDYADEWLWRAAMHFRWSYEHDRELLSRILADEVASHLKAPRIARRWLFKIRQRLGFVVNDGVRKETWDHVEAGYYSALKNMETMLATRPYLLGDTPSIADIGFMGPMLRHFGQDPTPNAIMRRVSPAVFDWLSRVWNANATAGPASFLTEVPEDARPMLKEIAETHMVQLRENARAWARGDEHFEMTVQGCHYIKLPTSQYRVWCLEQLRKHFAALEPASRDKVKALLPEPEFALIWEDKIAAPSNYDLENKAPFNKAINVFKIDRRKARI